MPENEYTASPLESLPKEISHAEIVAANRRQWASGVVPNEPTTGDEESERMPGLPREPGLRMPSFGGISSDQPEAVTRPEPQEQVITPMNGDWPCR